MKRGLEERAEALRAAEGARRQAVVEAMAGLHKVLLFFVLPVVLAVYVAQAVFWPCWQFNVVLAVAASCAAGWFWSRWLAAQGHIEHATLVVFFSVFIMSVVAGLLRQRTISMSELAIVATLVVVWLGHPGFLLVAGGLSLGAVLLLRLVEFFSWVPAVAASPLLDVAFDAGVSMAVFVAFIMLLRAGAAASRVPFDRLGAAFGSVLAAQPEIRELTESVRSNANVVAAGATQQATAAQQVASAAGALESSLVKTGTATTEARAIAGTTKDSSSKAWEGLQRVATQLEVYLKAVETVVSTIGDLAQRTERTEDVIKTIEEVNTNVKILSVNAALEATRAGESGRAIGIVADRMRDLIGQTDGSLRQGRELLVAIRRDAASAAREASSTAAEFRRHLEDLHGAAKAMRQIIDSFNETSENIATIAEQSAAQREQIEAVKASAEDLSSSAVGLTRSASELVESAQRMAATQAKLEGVVLAGGEAAEAA